MSRVSPHLLALLALGVALGAVAAPTAGSGVAGAGPFAGSASIAGTGVADTGAAGPGVGDSGAAAVPALGTGPPAQGTTPTSGLTANRTTFVVQLHGDGDATWTVRTRFHVVTEQDRAAFEDVATRFDNGQAPAMGLEAFRAAVAAVDARTDRSMGLTGVSRTVDHNESTLAVRFRWTNFARDEGDHYVVHDAFNTSDGTWFRGLTDGQSLVVNLPSGYGFWSTPQGARLENRQLRWDGPEEFEPGYFRIEYSSSPGVLPQWLLSLLPGDGVVASGLLLVGVVAVGTWVLTRREGGRSLPVVGLPGRDEPVGNGSDASPDGEATGATEAAVATAGATGGSEAAATDDGAAAAGATGAPEGAGTADGTGTADAAGTTGGAGAAGNGGTAGSAEAPQDAGSGDGRSGAGAGAGTADAVDDELLSDEERVERLLEANGGRMKQATIVKETGWSNAKVSQLLSSMAEDGRVDKLRIGRENLISFPDEDVADLEE